ncbi:MAG: VanZ family protein [Candidatus Methylomirabilia bacterium]
MAKTERLIPWAAPAETRWALLNWPGWARRVVLICFFAVINWMIFAPADTFQEVHEFFAHQDKLAHGAIFLLLALLVRWSFPGGAARDRLDGWLRYGVPAALALYACSTEFLQPLVGGKGRQFEWLDMASNVSGICAGWLLYGGAVAGAQDGFSGLFHASRAK